MIRFSIIRVAVCVVAAGFVVGLTQSAQAQCQNGMCRASAPSGTAVVSSTKQTPVNTTATVNAQPTIVTQPACCNSVNNCGSAPIVSGSTYTGCWSNCNSYPTVVYSSVPYTPVQNPTYHPTSTGCSGGTCNLR